MEDDRRRSTDLSTPSLGITRDANMSSSRRGRMIFQLPLSGSQVDGKCQAPQRLGRLSTPSLGITGRDHHALAVPPYLSTPSLGITENSMEFEFDGRVLRLSTPSLGITLRFYKLRTRSAWHPFNSLSRDHRARFRDFPALRGFLPRHPFAQMISKTTIWLYRFAPL